MQARTDERKEASLPAPGRNSVAMQIHQQIRQQGRGLRSAVAHVTLTEAHMPVSLALVHADMVDKEQINL